MDLTAEQEKKRDSFFRMLNRIELNQKAIDPDENDLMKATYRIDEPYSIVFTNRKDTRMYEATYKGGELIKLIPRNEELFQDINEGYKDNLAEPDLTNIISISNPVKNLEQSIVQQAFQPIPYSIAELKNDLKFSSDSLSDFKAIEKLQHRLDESIQREESLYQTLDEYIERTNDIENNPVVREMNQEDILLKIDEYKHMQEGVISRLNELERLHETTNVLSSIKFNELRQEDRLNELYPDNPLVHSLQMMDKEIPFIKGFEQAFKEESKTKGLNHTLGLAMNHQISEPNEQVKMHLTNYKNIQEYINEPYSNLSKELHNQLQELSYDSMDKAINVVNRQFANNHEHIKANIKLVRNEDKTVDTQREYNNLFNLLKPVTQLNEKEINLFTINEISSEYSTKVSEYWHQETLTKINDYISKEIEIDDKQINLIEADKGISILALKGDKRTNSQDIELEEHLTTIYKAIDGLEKKSDELQPNVDEVRQMISYLKVNYENIVDRHLSVENKSKIIEKAYSLNNEKGIEYEQLVNKIAELEGKLKESKLDEKEPKKAFELLSETVKQNYKKEMNKLHEQVERLSQHVTDIKENFKKFTYGKVESVYKVAFNAIDKLDKKLINMKTEIEKDIQAVHDKTQPKEQIKQPVEIER